MALYNQTIPQLLKMLTNLEGWLTKAESFCAEQDIPLPVLLEQRLYPNMYNLRLQVQRACSNATLVADRLGGVARPDITENEDTFAELRQRVASAKAVVESASESEFVGAEDRMVQIPGIDGMNIRGEDLASEFSLPNVYFHLTIAYGIMRSVGVPVGKADFMGPLALVPAS